MVFESIGVVFDLKNLISMGLVFFLILVTSGALYFELYRPLIKSLKFLKRNNMYNEIENINLCECNLPKSKIFLGENIFFSKSSNVILPYSEIVWVYIKQTKAFGIATVDEEVILMCRDGKEFRIRAERNELEILLSIINKHSSDLILGYGDEQMKQYQIIRQFKK